MAQVTLYGNFNRGSLSTKSMRCALVLKNYGFMQGNPQINSIEVQECQITPTQSTILEELSNQIYANIEKKFRVQPSLIPSYFMTAFRVALGIRLIEIEKKETYKVALFCFKPKIMRSQTQFESCACGIQKDGAICYIALKGLNEKK